MYCECFSLNEFCGPDCSCVGCSNGAAHTAARTDAQAAYLIKTNKVGAFKPRVATTITCNCKKSQCKKMYCDCHAGGRKVRRGVWGGVMG